MWGVGSTVGSSPCLVLSLKGNRQRSVATSGHLFWTGESYFAVAKSLFTFVVLPGPCVTMATTYLLCKSQNPEEASPPPRNGNRRPPLLRLFAGFRPSSPRRPGRGSRLQQQVRHGLAALRQRRQVASPVGPVGAVGAA